MSAYRYNQVSPAASLNQNDPSPDSSHRSGNAQDHVSYDDVSLEASESLLSDAPQPPAQEHPQHLDDDVQRQYHHRSPSPTPVQRLSFDSLEERPSQPPLEPAVDPHAAFPTQLQPAKQGRAWWRTWYMEVLSSVIAAGCLGAIVAILSTHEGQPLPEWRFDITINALIAVFTTIFKAALAVPIAEGISQFKWLWFGQPRELADVERIDRASRGVWGSFLLLFTRVPRLGMIWLVNIGAMLTIAALAVDPFSQQIIQSAACAQNATSSASIPKTQNYDRFGTHLGPNEASLDGAMQVAIYLGLLSPPQNGSTAVTATCPSGNCTFPLDDGATFISLGMCRSCVDISSTIAYNVTATNLSSLAQSTLPSGIFIEPTVMFASTTYGRFNPLLGFEALMSRNENASDAFAVRCSLDPCRKTYRANVTGSVYTEEELATVPLRYNTNSPSYSLASDYTLRDGAWQYCHPSAQNSSTNTLQVNTTTMTVINPDYSDPLDSGTSMWYPADCVWQLQQQAVYSMSAFLGDFFYDKTLNSAYSFPTGAYGDTWLVDLYRNGTATMDSVNAYMDGLVWSMTAAMRQNSADAEALRAVQGQALVLKTCLVVRWAWLSLPAALLVLEVVFLVAVVVVTRTSKHWREDWKSSSLALLYHGLDRDSKGQKGINDDWRQGDIVPRGVIEMMEAAKGTMVQLRESDAGWQFVG